MNRILRSIVLSVLLILLCVSAFVGFKYYDNQQKQTVSVLTVSKEIPPRTQITKKMFDEGVIKVTRHPKSLVPPNVYKDPKDVIGKFTSTNYTVPQYSYLYKDLILDAEKIKDGAALLLKEGERMMAIDVNMKNSLAAQISEGSYVDLWLNGKGQDQKAITGPFLQNVRIIGTYTTGSQKVVPTGITESQQNEQNQTYGEAPQMLGVNLVPRTMLIAVDDQQAFYIQSSQTLGEINVIGRGVKAEDTSVSTNQLWSVQHMQKWILSQISESYLSLNHQDTAKAVEEVVLNESH
ncbi:RcpC/CpaB family pilus assembly protein [Schinkia azotoformans]|uniref:Flp pilus assembly protein CpaB n=1 Tax=Schinkia azotoformans TaxID=1454 RepID=UPI002E1F2D5C|nr:RcpC/CpaB family pilus assembly protein [Schinkia azotoformans]